MSTLAGVEADLAVMAIDRKVETRASDAIEVYMEIVEKQERERGEPSLGRFVAREVACVR